MISEAITCCINLMIKLDIQTSFYFQGAPPSPLKMYEIMQKFIFHL